MFNDYYFKLMIPVVFKHAFPRITASPIFCKSLILFLSANGNAGQSEARASPNQFNYLLIGNTLQWDQTAFGMIFIPKGHNILFIVHPRWELARTSFKVWSGPSNCGSLD